MIDTISRQAAQNKIKEICERWHIGYEEGDRHKGGCSAWDFGHAMESLPSIDNWIPVVLRELTEEERKEHPNWCHILDCPMPDDGDKILVTNGNWVWKDECCFDDGYYLDSGDDWADITAWQPLPKPYRVKKAPDPNQDPEGRDDEDPLDSDDEVEIRKLLRIAFDEAVKAEKAKNDVLCEIFDLELDSKIECDILEMVNNYLMVSSVGGIVQTVVDIDADEIIERIRCYGEEE